MARKKRIWLNVILTILILVVIFLQNPNLNPIYSDGAFAWLVILTLYVALNLVLGLGNSFQMGNGQVVTDLKSKLGRGPKRLLLTLGALWVAFFLVSLASSPIVNFWRYRDQLGQPEQAEFTDSVQPLALDQLPIVDQALALQLADKKVGENPGLGSQVTLGEPVIQQVAGKLVWVVPLEHSGFFKWLQNMDGSQGYIVVSATDMQDVTLVEDHKIKYQAGAYLLDNLERHVRLFSGGLFTGLADYSFELDDDGQPFWVVTTYRNRWLFSLPEASGVLVVNATTGETQRYAVDAVPDWVDRVQPEDFIMNQIQNQGQYVHGIFNFANKDKFRPSQGHIIVYNEGNCYLFTGLTSVGSDESAIGFMMVDMVSKEAKYYQMNGATEIAAQQSAQGKVQQYGYAASYPMIINLDGQATYFMTLKDKAGLIKQFAFVSVGDYTSVGTGETISAALRNFRQVTHSNNTTIDTGSDQVELTGTVTRIAPESLGDTITYKFILEEAPHLLFTAAYDLSNELALTEVGDRVAITYTLNESGICPATAFDNLAFTQSAQALSPTPETPPTPTPTPDPSGASPTASPDAQPADEPGAGGTPPPSAGPTQPAA